MQYLLSADTSLPGQHNAALQATQHEEFSTVDYPARADADSLKQVSLFQENHCSHRRQTASQEAPGQVATDGSVPAGSVYSRNMIAKVIAEEIDSGQHH